MTGIAPIGRCRPVCGNAVSTQTVSFSLESLLFRVFDMIDSTKTRFLLVGSAVIGLGVILGTGLWLKFGPHPAVVLEQSDSNGMNQYGSVPEFTFTERNGSLVSLQQLRGKIWVADFIYTSCTDTCPLQTAMMAQLQEKYATDPAFQLVSFTVDPQRDTPQALTEYAAKYQADSKRWYFLTGQRDRILRLVQDGFHLAVASFPDAADPTGLIAHSPRFVLVDKDARIRGYYDTRESEAFVRLKNDIDALAKG